MTTKRKPITDADIEAWAERHDLTAYGSAHGTDLRSMFEDAASLHLTKEAKPITDEELAMELFAVPRADGFCPRKWIKEYWHSDMMRETTKHWLAVARRARKLLKP